jgi:hypothetical protein
VSIISPQIIPTPGRRLPRLLTSTTVDSSHTSRFAGRPRVSKRPKNPTTSGFLATRTRKIRDPNLRKNPRPRHAKSATCPSAVRAKPLSHFSPLAIPWEIIFGDGCKGCNALLPWALYQIRELNGVALSEAPGVIAELLTEIQGDSQSASQQPPSSFQLEPVSSGSFLRTCTSPVEPAKPGD